MIRAVSRKLKDWPADQKHGTGAEAPVYLAKDEATSALDEGTEAEILRNIQKLEGKTCLIVTHRPAALKICNRHFILEELAHITYYALIGGYKSLFYNPMTRTYLPGTTFEDILVLYRFDDALRDLVFKNIRIVELELRSMISYYFCET